MGVQPRDVLKNQFGIDSRKVKLQLAGDLSEGSVINLCLIFDEKTKEYVLLKDYVIKIVEKYRPKLTTQKTMELVNTALYLIIREFANEAEKRKNLAIRSEQIEGTLGAQNLGMKLYHGEKEEAAKKRKKEEKDTLKALTAFAEQYAKVEADFKREQEELVDAPTKSGIISEDDKPKKIKRPVGPKEEPKGLLERISTFFNMKVTNPEEIALFVKLSSMTSQEIIRRMQVPEGKPGSLYPCKITYFIKDANGQYQEKTYENIKLLVKFLRDRNNKSPHMTLKELTLMVETLKKNNKKIGSLGFNTIKEQLEQFHKNANEAIEKGDLEAARKLIKDYGMAFIVPKAMSAESLTDKGLGRFLQSKKTGTLKKMFLKFFRVVTRKQEQYLKDKKDKKEMQEWVSTDVKNLVEMIEHHNKLIEEQKAKEEGAKQAEGLQRGQETKAVVREKQGKETKAIATERRGKETKAEIAPVPTQTSAKPIKPAMTLDSLKGHAKKPLPPIPQKKALSPQKKPPSLQESLKHATTGYNEQWERAHYEEAHPEKIPQGGTQVLPKTFSDKKNGKEKLGEKAKSPPAQVPSNKNPKGTNKPHPPSPHSH